jgi:nickel superoxide dismutase
MEELMYRIAKTAALATILIVATAAGAWSHCQMPCGIYDDSARYDMLTENINTIEKAMDQITTLSAQEPVNYNQIVRWVNTKENHASELQEIVSDYFLDQRIKPAAPEDEAAYQTYIKHLTLFHTMLIEAMKCKQTTDMTHIGRLRDALEASRKLYFSK